MSLSPDQDDKAEALRDAAEVCRELARKFERLGMYEQHKGFSILARNLMAEAFRVDGRSP